MKSGTSWPKGLAVIRDVIAEAILQEGTPHQVGGDGPNVKAVCARVARDIHQRRYVSTGAGDRATAERKSWSRNFKQALAARLIAGELKEEKELIWFVT